LILFEFPKIFEDFRKFKKSISWKRKGVWISNRLRTGHGNRDEIFPCPSWPETLAKKVTPIKSCAHVRTDFDKIAILSKFLTIFSDAPIPKLLLRRNKMPMLTNYDLKWQRRVSSL